MCRRGLHQRHPARSRLLGEGERRPFGAPCRIGAEINTFLALAEGGGFLRNYDPALLRL